MNKGIVKIGLTSQIMTKLSQKYEYLWPIATMVFRAAELSLRFSPIMLNVNRVKCNVMYLFTGTEKVTSVVQHGGPLTLAKTFIMIL